MIVQEKIEQCPSSIFYVPIGYNRIQIMIINIFDVSSMIQTIEKMHIATVIVLQDSLYIEFWINYCIKSRFLIPVRLLMLT